MDWHEGFSGSLEIGPDAIVRDNAHVGRCSRVIGKASVSEWAQVRSRGTVAHMAVMTGRSVVARGAVLTGCARMSGCAILTNGAVATGYIYLSGEDSVRQDGYVYEQGHVLTITGLFEESVSLYRTRGGGHKVAAGCQVFELTDDLEEIANENSWSLPNGWHLVRDLMLTHAESWVGTVDQFPFWTPEPIGITTDRTAI